MIPLSVPWFPHALHNNGIGQQWGCQTTTKEWREQSRWSPRKRSKMGLMSSENHSHRQRNMQRLQHPLLEGLNHYRALMCRVQWSETYKICSVDGGSLCRSTFFHTENPQKSIRTGSISRINSGICINSIIPVTFFFNVRMRIAHSQIDESDDVELNEWFNNKIVTSNSWNDFISNQSSVSRDTGLR